MKYIVVTGGVISGLGKGTVASSIGLLLRSYGLRVTAIKIDPYLNFDSGLHSPFEHGECYVLNDGGETDLDLGNYERFLNINLTSKHSLTSGKVFKNVIDRERQGHYLGQTVQMVPHVTDYIKEWLLDAAKVDVGYGYDNNDVCIIELGGTVGDHEGSIYYEALADLYKPNDVCYVHVSLVPKVGGDEIKTKPTQHSIRLLRSLGIDPDIVILRSKRELTDKEVAKVSRFCKMPKESIIVNQDVSTIYEVPRLFLDQNLLKTMESMGAIPSLNVRIPDFKEYNMIMSIVESDVGKITVGVVGKYMGINDTYLSLIRALEHAGFSVDRKIQIVWIDSEQSNDKISDQLQVVDCVVIPGGFGQRGVQGMIHTSKWCREKNKPLLGICLGMQVMCIDLDRNLLGNKGATSEEFNDDTERKTVVLSEEVTKMGATMRLGSYDCELTNGSLAIRLYKGQFTIKERHRHRYEISPEFVKDLEKDSQTKSLAYRFTGRSPCGRYMEILEGVRVGYYMGCQFHPEYKSRHSSPHPLFVGLLQSTIDINKL